MAESPDIQQVEDDITLRAWENDETCLADLVKFTGSMQVALRHEFKLSEIDAEEFVAEAIRRFWEKRAGFDNQRKLRPYLYRIAQNVAKEHLSGRLLAQKAKKLERSVDEPSFDIAAEVVDSVNAELDTIEESTSGICQALKKCLGSLSDIQREIIMAYGLAYDYELDAALLGIEFGKKYNGGVPYPEATIRQYKKRAKDKLASETRKLGFDLRDAGIEK